MKGEHGFLFVELLISLSLVSLICALTIANFSFLHTSLVHAEIDAIYNACMFMQRRAMATNRKQTLTFDHGTQSYSFDGRTITLADQVLFAVIPGVKGPPACPKQEINKPITFQQQAITFYPDGIIKPGTVYLVDRDKQVMYALSCAVSQVSFLRTYRYAHTGWQLLN